MKKIPLYEVREINNLRDMLYSSTELFNEKAAFLFKPSHESEYIPVSYKQFRSDIDSFGTVLLNLGLLHKRIAIIGENKYEWSTSYLSVINGLGIVVPIDKELPEAEIVSCLTRAKVSAVIFSGKKKSVIESIMPQLGFVEHFIDMDAKEDYNEIFSFSKLVKKGYELLSQSKNEYSSLQINSEDTSVILFTSATTSESKAVLLSHKNICENLMAMCSMVNITPQDTFLSILPIHHAYECTCGFLCPIYRGSTVAFCEGLRYITNNLKESKVTILLGVPLVFESMYKKIWAKSQSNGLDKKLKFAIKLSNILRKAGINITHKIFSSIYENIGTSIRLFISGAAGIDPRVAKGFREFGIGFIQGYGLTECAPIVALNRDVDFKDDAAGLPLPGLDVRIDNANEDNIGEIIVKGPSVMSGYYEQSEETSKVFDENGYFHTGDLGYMDKNGFVHITGRKKNVIVTKNGKNIFPEEIETLLNRSPYINESLVFGLNKDSEDVIVAATIVPNMEYIEHLFASDPPSKEKLFELIQNEVKSVNKSLTTYKYVKHINLREEEFIKTTTKKIKRYMN